MNEQKASLRENLRALPRGAWILFIGTFLNKFGTFVLPFLALYMGELGYSIPQAGIAIGGYGVGTLVSCLVGGYLADRFGRRQTIVLSMFSVAVVMMCLSQARSLPMIVAFSTLAGFTGELYRPASSALLADLVPAGQRVTAFAAYRLALNAGWAFGPATAGLLSKVSYLWLFVGEAVSSVLFGLVAWFALSAPPHVKRETQSWLDTWTVLRADRRFRQVMASSLVVGLVFVQAFSTWSVEITNHGFPSWVYGLLISTNGVLVVLFELPITTITKRFPARRVMAIGYMLIGLGFASNLTDRTLALLVMTVVLFTFGEMIAMPISGAYVADLAPEDRRGLYMGTWGLTWSLAFVVGPSVGMLLFARSPVVLWAACGLLGLIAAWIITAEPRKRPELAPALATK